MPRVSKDTEQRELWFSAGGNINWYPTFGNAWHHFQDLNTNITYDRSLRKSKNWRSLSTATKGKWNRSYSRRWLWWVGLWNWSLTLLVKELVWQSRSVFNLTLSKAQVRNAEKQAKTKPNLLLGNGQEYIDKWISDKDTKEIQWKRIILWTKVDGKTGYPYANTKQNFNPFIHCPMF